MWGKDTMTMGEAFVISLTGITIVFLTLISLAIAIVIISKVVNTFIKDKPAETKPAPKAKKEVATPVMEPSLIAAIIGAVSMEVNESLENFQIVSIQEKGAAARASGLDGSVVAAMKGAIGMDLNIDPNKVEIVSITEK